MGRLSGAVNVENTRIVLCLHEAGDLGGRGKSDRSDADEISDTIRVCIDESEQRSFREERKVRAGISSSGKQEIDASFLKVLAEAAFFSGTRTARLGERLANSTLQKSGLHAEGWSSRKDSSAAFNGANLLPASHLLLEVRLQAMPEIVRSRLLTLSRNGWKILQVEIALQNARELQKKRDKKEQDRKRKGKIGKEK